MSADRNLLFGILALQLDFINREQLVAAMHAWVLTKQRTLGELLLEHKALDAGRRQLLEALVGEHLKQHGGDAQKSLAAVSSLESARESLEQVRDLDVQASLVHVAADKADAGATLPSAKDEARLAGRRFRILRPHAKGGLGQVSVARDLELQREVALKEIQERHADHAESRSRFLLEAEVTGGLEHPGIVPVYGLGTYGDGRPFYAMRFIRGDSLKEAIEQFHDTSKPGSSIRGGLQGERLVEFRKLLGRFVDVCEAIAYAHSRGVLHRDLKPGNIMLGKFGETLVVDWGLAKTLDSTPHQTESASSRTEEAPLRPSSSESAETVAGHAMGTPQYMPPEQADGRLDLLGPASDVYSLGATLYHLLTGQAPFTDRDVEVVLAKVRKGEFPSPTKVNPSVSLGLEAICLKAMSLQSADRYATPQTLAEDVEHWLADEPVSAWPEPWKVKAARWVSRHRVAVTSAAAVLVVATAALVAGNWLLAEANADLERAGEETAAALEKEQSAHKIADTERKLKEKQLHFSEALLYNSTIREAAMHWRDGDFIAMRAALDECSPERRGPEYGYLARQCDQTVRLLGTQADTVRRLALSSDGKRLYTGLSDGTIKVWDLLTGKEMLSLVGHRSQVSCLALSADRKQLFSGSWDCTIKVWDLEAGTELYTLRGHTLPVVDLVLPTDGKRLVSGSADKTIKVWNLEVGKETLSLTGHTSPLTSLALSADSKRLYSGSEDRTIKVWDLEAGKEARSLRGHTGAVSSLALSSDGKRLYSGSMDKTIKAWDLEAGKEALSLRGHTGEVTNLALSADGKRLYSGSDDSTIKVWDLEAGKETLSLRGRTHIVWSLSSDGKRLYSGSWDETIKVWDLEAGKETLSLRGHTHIVWSLALSADGKRLYSGSADKTIKVWDLEAGKETLSLRGHTGTVLSLALSADGKRLYSGSADKTIKVWDLEAGKETLSLRGHTGTVQSLALSADGKRLYSGSWDFDKPAEIKVWDLEAGKEALSLRGHTEWITSLALSSDGKRLYSGSGDSTIKVWDLEAGKEALSLRGHTGTVTSLALSSDGKRLFSGSDDTTIKVWDFTHNEPTKIEAKKAE